MAETYTCHACGHTFGKRRSDDEAKAEAAVLFPGLDPDDPDEAVVVCDDCWKKMCFDGNA